MNILVFDDNQTHREAAQAQLTALGHTVTVAGDYSQAQELLHRDEYYLGTDKLPSFDAVLCDLLVPASEQRQSGQGLQYVGQEMPIGVFIALLAATKVGVKYVGVLTDTDHHSHPASACFDAFNGHVCEPTPFVLNDCKVIFTNNHQWVGPFAQSDLTKQLGWSEANGRTDTVRAKNWTALLEYLLR